jgi:3-(3-hydroxy-phenyl)propionate hydroxylase
VTADYDVIIVGFGPVGQMAANLLGQRGYRVGVFEVASSIYNLPRAVHFDAEVMRIFQSVGLAEAVLPACAEIKGYDFVNADRQRLFGFRPSERPTPNGWPIGYVFYQPDLEAVLQTGVRRFPNVDVFAGDEVLAIEQSTEQVVVRVRDLATDEERAATSDWLWGCDGARSLARKTAGIELEDLGFEQPWLVVDTIMKRDADLPEILLQVCDPARPTTVIHTAGKHRRWEFMLMPGDEPAEMERQENVWRLLSDWVTPLDAEVIRAVVYWFHALIARSYRDRRLFILVDAAHQMPPFLGQGMCAGIRDAHNLVWKLDLVRAGLASDTLLNTYYEERAPHVREIITRAVTAGNIIQTTDPEVAARRDAMFLATEKREATVGETDDGPLKVQMPGLKSGVLASGSPAGELFPQPSVEIGGTTARLDDAYGGGWAVVAGRDASALFTEDVREAWSFIGPRFVEIGGSAAGEWVAASERDAILAAWLVSHGACVVRPDLYVYGTARTADGLMRLATSLRSQLGEPLASKAR